MTSSTRARLLFIDPYDNIPPHMLSSISQTEVIPVDYPYDLHGREDGSVAYLYGSAWAADQSRMLDLFYVSGTPNKERAIRYFEAISSRKCPYEPTDSFNLGYVILVNAMPSPYTTYGWKSIDAAKKSLEQVKIIALNPNYVFAVLNGHLRDAMALEDMQMVLDEDTSIRFIACNPLDRASVRKVLAGLFAQISYNGDAVLQSL